MSKKNTKSKSSANVKRFSETDKKNLYAVILITAVLGIFSYSGGLNNTFTNWDDEEMVVNNPAVKSLSVQNILSQFTTFHHSHYHPLVNISYAIEYRFAGLNPFVYHLTNLLFHLMNSILVYLILLRLSKNNFIAALAAILFAVHPLHTESVAWITERKDMLYSFFFLLAVLFYQTGRESKTKKQEVYVYLFFILSCLSKASAVTLPVVLLLVDYFNEKKLTAKDIKEKIPLFVISLLFGIINIMAQYEKPLSGSLIEIPQFDILSRILIVFYNYTFYLYKAFLPFNLSAFYPYPDPSVSALPVVFWAAPLVTGLIIYLVYLSRKLGAVILFGMLFYTLTIFPVLQIVPVGRAITADRFAYLPLLGVLLVFSYLLHLLYENILKSPAAKKVLLGLIAVLVIGLAYLTRNQNMIWESSMTLYSDMVKKFPENSVGYNNRGTLFLKENRYNEAESDFSNALKYNNRYAAAYNNMGLLLNGRTKYDNAIEYFSKAVELNNNYAEAYFNMGLTYFNKSETDKAIEYYKKAISIDPGFAVAYNNLGKAYGLKEQNQEAITNFSKAIELDPEYSTAHFNLAVAYFKTGNNTAGLNEMKTAAKLGNSGALEFCKKNNIPLN
ncbi:MAG TPA: tetratricopeptide repeat protein [Ignavibacteria bacterium]|nr:tetratricopeptide repeat protein [Ignavibacteria bacterium]